MNDALSPITFCLFYFGSFAAIMILFASAAALTFWLLTKLIDLLLLFFLAVFYPRAMWIRPTKQVEFYHPDHLKRAGQ
jgi:hypothetical protein